MQTQNTRTLRDTTRPSQQRLTLQKETLRRLTPAGLRLAAGGALRITAFSCLCDLEMKRG
jgi:hypothetical protein